MTSKRSLRSVVLLVLTFTMLTFSWTAFAADSDLGQDVNFIDVQKAFVGIEASQIPSGFTIQVQTQDSSEIYYLSPHSDEYSKTQSVNENGNTIVTWRLDALTAGTYKISETNNAIDGYTTLEPEGLGNVTIQPAQLEFGEINKVDNNEFILTENNLWFAPLTGKYDNATVVISYNRYNSSERLAIQNWLNTEGLDLREPYYFFSIEEQLEEGDFSFTIKNDAEITYYPDTGKITFGSTSMWKNKTYSGTFAYTGAEAEHADVEITNQYILQRLLVSKTVEGNLGSKNKAFEYTVKLPEMAGKTVSCNLYADETLTTPIRTSSITLDENGATTFTLSHGQTAVFDAIWGDYTVEETPVGEYEISINGVKTESATANGTIAAGDNRVDFTNVLQVSPPTGIHDSVGAAGLMLMLAAAMLAILRIGGERRRYE